MGALCSGCGAVLPTGARFCIECGVRQGVPACQICGEANPEAARFCASCGAAVGVSPAPVPAPSPNSAPITERRVCSVLFCDLVGITAFSEDRDAEDVRALLSTYFDAAKTVITRYGGVVEKFIGDAVMAVWGTPAAGEGDAERAVRAALDLVDAVVELREANNAPGLAARAGVLTGEVAVAVGAVGQALIAGDAVNTAARVQEAANPGTVLVDEGTWRAARAGVGFTPMGKRALKGKREPVALWRAERVTSGIGGALRVDGLAPAFVGRESELRLVKELFHACAERRSPGWCR